MAPLEQDRVGQKSRNPPNEPECGCWSFGKFKQNLGLGVVARFLIAEMHFPGIFRKLWALLNLLEGPLKVADFCPVFSYLLIVPVHQCLHLLRVRICQYRLC